jgi:hypothetical protein
MVMVIFLRLFPLTLLCWSLVACQLGGHEIHTRTPHIPVFPEIVKDDHSTTSNPYWNQFTIYQDEIKVKVSTGNFYRTHNPAIIGALGTHYRFKGNYYLFMMTEGAGIQYDWFTSEKSKISIGLYGGFDVNHGAQLSYAREMGALWDGKITPYFSIQRRTSNIYIKCLPNPETGNCAFNDTTGSNEIWAKEQILEYIFGIQLGRFKLGSKGRTTVNFKGEIGLNQVLSHRIDRETYPSDYEHTGDALMIGFHAGFNLW